MTKEQGRLNLSTSQFQRMMNIVYLEGVIDGLLIAKNSYKGTDLFYKYDALIGKQTDRLHQLSKGNTPELLLREMLNTSLHENH